MMKVTKMLSEEIVNKLNSLKVYFNKAIWLINEIIPRKIDSENYDERYVELGRIGLDLVDAYYFVEGWLNRRNK